MADKQPKPSFWDIYHEQYRQVSSSPFSSAGSFWIGAPAGLMVAAVLTFKTSVVYTIVLAALGAGVFVTGVVWGRRKQRPGRLLDGDE